MQEAEERPERVGEPSDGWSLMGMDGTGCSAGRFSIHSAMASFMRGASAGQKNSGRRQELGPPLGIMSQVRQVLRQG